MNLLALLLLAVPPQDPAQTVAEAIKNTRAQKSYETKFDASLALPQGDPIKYRGESVWVLPGVLYIHFKASGGDEKQIVRVGKDDASSKAWVYHDLSGAWPYASELGMDGAGKGIQNPDEVLAVMSHHVAGAKQTGPRTFQLGFSGDDIQRIMKEQARADAFVWKESKVDLEFETDDKARLKKFTCKASLKSTDPKVQGVVIYTATVEVVSYNETKELKFIDSDKKPVELSDEMKKRIGAVLGEGK